MAIRLKTPQEIEKIRMAGRVVRKVLDHLGAMMAPGITTEELNTEAERICIDAGCQCLFKGVPGRGRAGPYPKSVCTSINEQLVHGIPSDRRVREGDIVSVDFGVRRDGWCSDAAETFCVGSVPQDIRRLVDVTRNSLRMAVELSRPGENWATVARAMQNYVESEGFSVVRDLVGHGIGADMWEDPKVPNYAAPDGSEPGFELSEGLVLAVEPMVNMGSGAIEYAADGWTVLTKDRRPCAHFEHTIAVTAGGTDVLTDGR